MFLCSERWTSFGEFVPVRLNNHTYSAVWSPSIYPAIFWRCFSCTQQAYWSMSHQLMFWQRRRCTLGESPVYPWTTEKDEQSFKIHTRTQSHGQFRVHSLPRVQVFGRWEEVAVLGENMQTKAFLLPHNFLWNEKLSSQMRHGHDIQPHTKFDPVMI